MNLLIFIGLNLLLMTTLFAVGMYQFMQIEEKRKFKRLLNEAELDVAELSALLQADRYDDALRRLMSRADVDRFTAESALERLKAARRQ